MLQEMNLTTDSFDELEIALWYVVPEIFDPTKTLTMKIAGDVPPKPPIIFDLAFGLVPQMPVLLIGEADYEYDDEDLIINDIIRHLKENHETLAEKFLWQMSQHKKDNLSKIDSQPTIGYRIELANIKPVVLAICLTYIIPR